MESLRTSLAPLTNWLPPSVRDLMPIEAWWAVLGGGGLLALIVLWLMLRALSRALFGGRRAPSRDGEEAVEDLAEYPPPPTARAGRRLWVYHLPARLRLVVLAPAGKVADIDATAVERVLDSVVPGLGAVCSQDRPRIRVWPPQLSQAGFSATFNRRTRKPEAEGQTSRWVLAAGKVLVGGQAVLIGLALLTDEPSNLGRVSLETHQWLDVLRLRAER